MNYKCAGIVLFNPEMERLKLNIISIKKQVDLLILVDNGSSNIEKIIKEYSEYNEILIIRNNKNKGIAFALNQICKKAIEKQFDWTLLLDQDSICSDNMIIEYKKYLYTEKVALLTPFIIDINKLTTIKYSEMTLPTVSEVQWAITSGSLVNLNILSKLKFFSEDLFIDMVDFDYSIRLNLNNYTQLRINSTYLLQEVGNAEKTKLFRIQKDNSGKWSIKRYYRTNHSILRQYYMTRNRIILSKKYSKYRSFYKSFFYTLLLSFPKIFVEKNKVAIFNTLFNGLRDGLKYDVEKYQL